MNIPAKPRPHHPANGGMSRRADVKTSVDQPKKLRPPNIGLLGEIFWKYLCQYPHMGFTMPYSIPAPERYPLRYLLIPADIKMHAKSTRIMQMAASLNAGAV